MMSVEPLMEIWQDEVTGDIVFRGRVPALSGAQRGAGLAAMALTIGRLLDNNVPAGERAEARCTLALLLLGSSPGRK